MSAPHSRGRWRPPTPGADYVAVLLGTELVVMVLGLLPGPGAWGPGLWQLAAYATGLVVGVFRWSRYAPANEVTGGGMNRGTMAPPLVRVFLALALALWTMDVGRRLVAGESLNPVWLSVVLLIVLLWARPLDAAAARWTIDAMAVAVMAAVGAALLLEVSGISPSWYVLRSSEALIGFDASYYWLPLADWFGLDGRWAGPFPHPNMAGPAGGFLLVVGMCRSGLLRWCCYAVGVLVLVLAASGSSAVAAAVATGVVLVAMLIWSRPGRVAGPTRSPVASWARYVSAAVGPLAALAIVVASTAYRGTAMVASAVPPDMAERLGTLTSRSTIWPVYVRIWQESPWWGSSDARIALAQARGELPDWAITAHDLYLDTLVRFGILGGIVVAAALVVAMALGVLSARRGSAVSLGIVTLVLVCGLVEVIVFWRLWALSTMLLFLSVVAAIEDGGVHEPDDPAAAPVASRSGTAESA